MPSKKKKYNARFPAGRIKKIMQTDEEVGKVAQAVPVIISRTLELFVESLLTKSMQITQARNAKTLTPSHMKQCILSESRFDFLKDLVKNVPDASIQEDNENNALCEEIPTKVEETPKKIEQQEIPVLVPKNPRGRPREKHQPHTEVSQSPVSQQSTSSSRVPVIHYGPQIVKDGSTIINYPVNTAKEEPELHITIASEQLPVPQLIPTSRSFSNLPSRVVSSDTVPPLIPISHYNQNTNDGLCIDEDYDN